MKLENLKGKKVLILGFGREGRSTANFLSKHFPESRFAVADQEIKEITDSHIEKTFFGKDYLSKLSNYEVIIKSPGIKFTEEIQRAVDEGIIVTSATAIFFHNFKGKIIGVTGTKGKSTTSSLIYEILKEGGLKVELVGNLGYPALDLLDTTSKQTYVIYELSSFQLENLDVSPYISVFVNIYPEHLDSHLNFGNYFKAKSNITIHQTQEDFLIYNSDFPELQELAKKTRASKIPYSKDSFIGDIKTKLKGSFNLQNIAASIIVGQILGIDDEKITRAIAQFNPLPHRLEFVALKKGVSFYNDSLATLPQATIAALNGLGDDTETLITGGFDRGLDYSFLGKAISESKIKNLILFPTTGEKIWESVKNLKGNIPEKEDVVSMKEAVRLAFEKTSKGKICLMSPASASFNMFKDYADRGDQFKEAVKNF